MHYYYELLRFDYEIVMHKNMNETNSAGHGFFLLRSSQPFTNNSFD